MAVSYEQALSFLLQKDPELTRQQAERLRSAAQDLCERVEQAATNLRQARDKAERLAQEAGFSGVEEMIKKLGFATIREQAAELRELKSKSVVVRKPFMSLEGDRIYSCAAHHATPPELKALLDKGWEKSELHYKNLAAACKARSVALTFDPVQRHAELAALERQ